MLVLKLSFLGEKQTKPLSGTAYVDTCSKVNGFVACYTDI